MEELLRLAHERPRFPVRRQSLVVVVADDPECLPEAEDVADDEADDEADPGPPEDHELASRIALI